MRDSTGETRHSDMAVLKSSFSEMTEFGNGVMSECIPSSIASGLSGNGAAMTIGNLRNTQYNPQNLSLEKDSKFMIPSNYTFGAEFIVNERGGYALSNSLPSPLPSHLLLPLLSHLRVLNNDASNKPPVKDSLRHFEDGRDLNTKGSCVLWSSPTRAGTLR